MKCDVSGLHRHSPARHALVMTPHQRGCRGLRRSAFSSVAQRRIRRHLVEVSLLSLPSASKEEEAEVLARLRPTSTASSGIRRAARNVPAAGMESLPSPREFLVELKRKAGCRDF